MRIMICYYSVAGQYMLIHIWSEFGLIQSDYQQLGNFLDSMQLEQLQLLLITDARRIFWQILAQLTSGDSYTSAIVTSTSTPGSIVILVIFLTTSGGLCKSITRLWTRNSNPSQVFVPVSKCKASSQLPQRKNQTCLNPERCSSRTTKLPLVIQFYLQRRKICCRRRNWPSPQGDFLVVTRKTFVGMRTGPLTFNLLSLAPRMRSAQTAHAHSQHSDRLLGTSFSCSTPASKRSRTSRKGNKNLSSAIWGKITEIKSKDIHIIERQSCTLFKILHIFGRESNSDSMDRLSSLLDSDFAGLHW